MTKPEKNLTNNKNFKKSYAPFGQLDFLVRQILEYKSLLICVLLLIIMIPISLIVCGFYYTIGNIIIFLIAIIIGYHL